MGAASAGQPADAPEADHKEALTNGFRASMHALCDKGLDEDDEEAYDKICQLGKAHRKLAGDMEESESDDPDDLEDEPDDGVVTYPREDEPGRRGGPLGKSGYTNEQRDFLRSVKGSSESKADLKEGRRFAASILRRPEEY